MQYFLFTMIASPVELQGKQRKPHLAATDQVRALSSGDCSYLTLGTDGFGRSDTRAALRAFFGVDAASVVQAAIKLLGKD